MGASMDRRERDGIWIIDAQANTLYANDRMAEILGTTVTELTGKPSFEYVFPKDVERAQGLFGRKKSGELTRSPSTCAALTDRQLLWMSRVPRCMGLAEISSESSARFA
jgi:PAS domain S-box-containing protein